MYSRKPGYVLGFHGCDQSVVDKIVAGKSTIRPSKNDYDWLGNGSYFWEHSPSRAKKFAEKLARGNRVTSQKITKPSVLGAVISLGNCLDLLEDGSLTAVKTAYELYKELGLELTTKPNEPHPKTGDLLLRYEDCAVIELLHLAMIARKLPAYDSVRGAFFEGKPLFTNSGFHAGDHIQICIRNPNCIKGYFIPLKRDEDSSFV